MKTSKAGKALISVLIGSAVGVGSAFLFSKVRKRGSSLRLKEIGPHKMPKSDEPYCDVPEGADVCYPQSET